MTSEQIIVRITSDGQIHAETKGLLGPKCLDSIQLLEELLEAQTTSSEFTHEYNYTTTTNEVDDELRQQ